MTKKLFLNVLIGFLVISATACGNKQNEKLTVTVDAKEQYNSMFSQSVFLGDSLLIGLSDVLKESNVIAYAGATARFALERVDDIVNKKPENVFIMLGSDDLLWPTDNPQEYSLTYYVQLIERIQSKLPNAKIHVLSVPPVTKEVMKVEPRYKNIPEYNKGLKKMAEKKKVVYIDLSPIFEEHPNLYIKDGIRFKPDFYQLLLNHIKKHIQSSKNNAGMRDGE